MSPKRKEKLVIYQTLPRLYGNMNDKCVCNGDINENGCGKMADFTIKRLKEIKGLGINYIWYTGLLEHATQTDYSKYGIQPDHPAIVKGKAGSPYAIKDYYDIDPDLAHDIRNRMKEFEDLVKRTHYAGLKMIIDFVPNHVARQYHSDSSPQNTINLGELDKTDNAFNPQNNFYYIPGEKLHIPKHVQGYSNYIEEPARATGNDKFDAWPSYNDWYETIKLNYGIDYVNGRTCHFDPIPNTWYKMRDILLFWAQKGIDAFRCDMAEMVPCEFWEWAIPQIKQLYPQLLFIAEIYNPALYRNYIHQGHFDYLYNKVGLYDTLRAVICHQKPASAITRCWQDVDDIQEYMLNFLENHDEQRIASDFFAGNAERGLPGFIVCACMNKNPIMIYAGQELGETGMDSEGFSGRDGRTTIFDYWSISSLRNWLKNGEQGLDSKTRSLRSSYQKLLKLCNKEVAIREGNFFDLMYANYDRAAHFNPDRQYAFIRKKGKEMLLIACNFDNEDVQVGIRIPQHAFDYLELKSGTHCAIDLISEETVTLELYPDKICSTHIPAYGGVLLKVNFN